MRKTDLPDLPDPNQNLRVIGAPGSAKTSLLIKWITDFLKSGALQREDILVLANSRAATKTLRHKLEAGLDSTFTSEMVRTAQSYAFALVNDAQSLKAEPDFKLLTGADQDEILAGVIEEHKDYLVAKMGFEAAAFDTAEFRNELRDLATIINDFDLDEARLNSLALTLKNQRSDSALAEAERFFHLWRVAAEFLDLVNGRRFSEESDVLTASEIIKKATELLKSGFVFSHKIPKLVVVDDAQEISQGAAMLLKAMHEAGSRVWVFGDPDIATNTFQTGTTKMLHALNSFLFEGSNQISPAAEQLIVLDRVFRHPSNTRHLITKVTELIGAAGLGRQRAAAAIEGLEPAKIVFSTVASVAQQAAVIANQIQLNDYDIDACAIVCRTQDEVQTLRFYLEDLNISTRVSTGGIVLKEQKIAVDLIVIALKILSNEDFTAEEIRSILKGPLIGFDEISLRRLYDQIALTFIGSYEGPANTLSRDEMLLMAIKEERALPPSSESKKFKVLLNILRRATTKYASGGSVREVLWQIWSGAGVAEKLREDALGGRGFYSFKANRELDAVMTLFYALQRHEEQNVESPESQLLEGLLVSDIASDTLAATANDSGILISTPQGVVGMEFQAVFVAGPQEGVWPNLKPRGSILGLGVLLSLIRDGVFETSNRLSLMHDELRLFAAALAKSLGPIFVLAQKDEEQTPSVFFNLGSSYEVAHLPDDRITPRGYVASLRAILEKDPSNQSAARKLAILAKAGLQEADPKNWYGVRELTSTRSIFTTPSGTPVEISISPSEIEKIENCPLHWVLGRLGSELTDQKAFMGTIVHEAFETSPTGDLSMMLEVLKKRWHEIDFDTPWQEQQEWQRANEMLEALSLYARDSARNKKLVGVELGFKMNVDGVIVKGVADRIEESIEENLEERTNLRSPARTVVDLKTGARRPSEKDTANHAQLQAYQAALLSGAFDEGQPQLDLQTHAQLLYVNPRVQNVNTKYRIFEQASLGPKGLEEFTERLKRVKEDISGSEFLARVAEHCEASRYAVPCSLQLVRMVGED